MNIGLKGIKKTIVNDTNTAKAVGSGSLSVFGTPCMIALMEASACECINAYLEENQSSVGTMINATHVSATPIGLEVYAESELVEIDGKRLVFNISAFDTKGLIGKAVHERFIINCDKFLERTNSKLNT